MELDWALLGLGGEKMLRRMDKRANYNNTRIFSLFGSGLDWAEQPSPGAPGYGPAIGQPRKGTCWGVRG